MATRDDIYLKFGVAAEAGQLIETELGTLVAMRRAESDGLLSRRDPERAAAILSEVNRLTLGSLRRSLLTPPEPLVELEGQIGAALVERNRLTHSFFRDHNFRMNSAEGRAVMYNDLEVIHATLLDTYKAIVLLTQGVDLDHSGEGQELPTRHIPI